MKFLDLAKKRYSVRRYRDKTVEQEKLDSILEAANVAPTACNNQPHKIIVVNTTEGFEKLQKGYPNTYGATLALIICTDHDQTWKRAQDNMDSGDIDAAIITDHMMLCATELGLGSVWLCAFDPVAIRSEFKIPKNIEPINILLLGYADREPASPDRHGEMRKSISQTVIYGSF